MTTPPDDDSGTKPSNDVPAAESAAPPAIAAPHVETSGPAPEPEIGDCWGSFPAFERRAKLDARLAEWADMPDHSILLGPFDQDGWPGGLDGADVYYLAVRSLAGANGDMADGLEQLQTPFVALPDLHLEHADLFGAHLEHAALSWARLEQVSLNLGHLEHADLIGAHLEYAALSGTHLEYATLSLSHLEHVRFLGAHLEHADLIGAHLDHGRLMGARLAGADLRGAFLDAGTDLAEAILFDAELGSVRVADVRWQGVNLATVAEWPADMVLGDEREAWKQVRELRPKIKTRAERREAADKPRGEVLYGFRAAARANRQLAAVMRDQGMNDDADHFAYRAQVMQHQVYRHQGSHGRAIFSGFLDLIAGYGYKPKRSARAYGIVITLFATLYFALSHLAGPTLSPLAAAVFSMTSFHGRGFFPGGVGLDDPITVLAALEALAGLIIEVSLIATFTQRFFGK